jgi:hypothetical protein|tara:strand:- start:249 stop:470 length:222 start_codon:yes stop_codon:yes gene_type:complete
MGLIDKIKAKSKEATTQVASPNQQLEDDILLNKEELGYLLTLIKKSKFKGKEIEIIYNLSWKLQKAYLYLNKD